MRRFIRDWLGIDHDLAGYQKHWKEANAEAQRATSDRLTLMFNQLNAVSELGKRDEFARAALCGGCSAEDAYIIADRVLAQRLR